MSTKIEWTDHVWNPVTGCTKVSDGCNCYAERMAKRLAGRHGYSKEKPFSVTLRPDRLDEPLRWRKPRLVFVNSMSDLFHEDVPERFIVEVYDAMERASSFGHVFQVLTKRPERMRDVISRILGRDVPLPGIWLGVSAEDQATADARIPLLLETSAAVRFVSCEPLLSGIGLRGVLPELDWVIAGSESGPRRRETDIAWVRSLRDQCAAAGTPFFLKQIHIGGKKVSTPELDGVIHDAMPEVSP